MFKNIIGLLLMVILFLPGCMSAKNSTGHTFGNIKQWLPKEFDPQKQILLVQNFEVSKNTNQKMIEYMESRYPYKFEFVDLPIIEQKQGKYADVDLYRFALKYTTHSYGYSTGRTVGTGFDYNFYDRSTGTEYSKTGKGSSFAIRTFKPVINTIIKHFE